MTDTKTQQLEPPAQAEAAEGWFTPLRFAVLLAFLVVAAFPGVLLQGQTFIIRDFGMFSYPVAEFYRASLARGELPLWNPLSHCGVPFLAQWNTMCFYPGSLIYLLLPMPWSLSVFSLFHLFWGGLGMYFLARRWTGNPMPAVLAGIVFSFNGLTLNFLMWPSHIATFSWFPWLVVLAQQAWRNGGPTLVLAILAGAMQMLAGGPETIILTWLLLALLMIGDWLKAGVARRQTVARFLIMALLVTLLCAVQLLPFLQLLAASGRDSTYASTSHNYSVPLAGLANLLVPIFRNVPTGQGVYFQVHQYWTTSYYTGIGTLLLTLVALRHLRRPQVWLLTALAVLGLVLALGDNGTVYKLVRICLPGVGFARYPVKFVILFAAVMPLLAAYGLHALQAQGRRPGRYEWSAVAVLLVLIGGILWFDWRYPAEGASGELTLRNGLGRALLLVFFAGAVSGFLKTTGNLRLLCGCLMAIALWLELVTHVPTQNPSLRSPVTQPGWARKMLAWEKECWPGQGRALLAPESKQTLRYHALPRYDEYYGARRLALFGNCNLLDNVPQVDGFYSTVPAQALRVTGLPYVQTNRNLSSLLDFMSVSHTTDPGTICQWSARPSPMPMITGGQRVIGLEDEKIIQAFSQTDVDLREVLFLPPTALSEIAATQRVASRVLEPKFGFNKITFESDSPAPAMVVISQTWYPAWKALVDNHETKLWRANYAFQALQVPAGRHKIQLIYHDRILWFGAALSTVGLLSCAGLWLRYRSRA